VAREIHLILYNIRSILNVGAILRTAEGLGVEKVIFSGYTPTPLPVSKELPHIAENITAKIHKTALGAEAYLDLAATDNILQTLENYRKDGFQLVGLENNLDDSRLIRINSPDFHAKIGPKIALVLGEEVDGITTELREKIDVFVEIPMVGRKESFNVSVATGMILYELKCYNIENRS
jgi:spoU rRNA methylase family protein